MQDKKATPERLTGVTERLCRTIAEIGSDSIPEEAVNVAKRVILDGIAVAIAGVHEEGPRIAADHIRSLGGTGDSVVLGMGFRANPVSAALVNGISIHILDFEPMWMPPTHAVSPSLPSVLAAAEMKKANGREVAAAFVKACEIQGRLNLAGKLLAPALLVHHPPDYLGVMGSAVGAGQLLGLSPEQLQNALGIAASCRRGAEAATSHDFSSTSSSGLVLWSMLKCCVAPPAGRVRTTAKNRRAHSRKFPLTSATASDAVESEEPSRSVSRGKQRGTSRGTPDALWDDATSFALLLLLLFVSCMSCSFVVVFPSRACTSQSLLQLVLSFSCSCLSNSCLLS